jgi:hypothetical protein
MPIRQERLNRTLIAAIKHNDTKKALALLDEGADPNSRDEPPPHLSFWRLILDKLQGKRPAPSTAPTALLLALEENEVHGQWVYASNHPQLIQALLDKGANPNVYLFPDETPLLDAVIAWVYAGDGRRGDTIKLLLDHGADPNPSSLESPLIYAIIGPDPKDDVLISLLNHGARIDAQVKEGDLAGDTALMEAVLVRSVHVTQLLLSYHANPTIQDKQGETPLSFAKRWASVPEERRIMRILQHAGAKD